MLNPFHDTWWHQALCKGTDVTLFYPEAVDLAICPEESQAKALCGRCPVENECLAFAIENAEQYGIWGGMNHAERRRARWRFRRGSTSEAARLAPTSKARGR